MSTLMLQPKMLCNMEHTDKYREKGSGGTESEDYFRGGRVGPPISDGHDDR